ncbi:MAG: 2-heptyl-3-hydroxy-4(1H)-quinolone synthase [Synoicihabitans sp.]
MKVLISGAGISGLMCANQLQQCGIEYDIIEKRDAFSSVGFELVLWSTTVDALKKIGMADTIAKFGVEIKGIVHRKPNNSVITQTSYQPIENRYGYYVAIDRDKLLRALEAKIGPHRVLRNTWLTDIAKSTRPTVTFNDGSRKEYDLIIGADGIKSSLRPLIDPRAEVIQTGHSFWLYRISSDIYSKPIFESYSGNGLWGILSPGKSESVVVLVTRTPSESMDKSAYLRSQFSNFHGRLRTALIAMPEENKIFQWEALQIKTHMCRNEHAVLIGDAAHAHPPSLSSGANLAIEDTLTLVQLITENRGVSETLERYEKLRQKRASYISRMANWTLRFHMMKSPFDYLTATALKCMDGIAANERIMGLRGKESSS